MASGIKIEEYLRLIGYGIPYEGDVEGSYVYSTMVRELDLSRVMINVLDHIPAEKRAKIEQEIADAISSGQQNSLGTPWFDFFGSYIFAVDELVHHRVRTSFKSGRSPLSSSGRSSWHSLTDRQRNWRINRVWGRGAVQNLRYLRGAGVAGHAVSVGLAGYNIVTGEGRPIDWVDGIVGIGAIGAVLLLKTPVGWVIGVGAGLYFTGRWIYDVFW